MFINFFENVRTCSSHCFLIPLRKKDISHHLYSTNLTINLNLISKYNKDIYTIVGFQKNTYVIFTNLIIWITFFNIMKITKLLY